MSIKLQKSRNVGGKAVEQKVSSDHDCSTNAQQEPEPISRTDVTFKQIVLSQTHPHVVSILTKIWQT